MLDTDSSDLALSMRPGILLYLVPSEDLAQFVGDGVSLVVRGPKDILAIEFVRQFAAELHGETEQNRRVAGARTVFFGGGPVTALWCEGTYDLFDNAL